jgi:hypothetical protein
MLQMRMLPKLDNFQIALRIFTASLLPRVRFLMSTLPVGAAQQQFAAWDTCVVEVLTALLKHAPPKHAFLPLSDGGLGLSLVSERHTEVFLCGKERACASPSNTFLTSHALLTPHAPRSPCALSATRCAPPAPLCLMRLPSAAPLPGACPPRQTPKLAPRGRT